MKTRTLFLILFLILFKLGSSQQPHSVSGVVTDAKSGKAIDAISIVIEENETGTISNYTGSYLLYMKQGSYAITFTGKGYQKKEIKVDLSEDQELMVELTPKSKSNKLKKKNRKKNGNELELLSHK